VRIHAGVANDFMAISGQEDWKPGGTGQKQRMSCDRWKGNNLRKMTLVAE
jgi:hypothetical protein